MCPCTIWTFSLWRGKKKVPGWGSMNTTLKFTTTNAADFCLSSQLWWPRLEPVLCSQWRRLFQAPLAEELERLRAGQSAAARCVQGTRGAAGRRTGALRDQRPARLFRGAGGGSAGWTECWWGPRRVGQLCTDPFVEFKLKMGHYNYLVWPCVWYGSGCFTIRKRESFQRRLEGRVVVRQTLEIPLAQCWVIPWSCRTLCSLGWLTGFLELLLCCTLPVQQSAPVLQNLGT